MFRWSRRCHRRLAAIRFPRVPPRDGSGAWLLKVGIGFGVGPANRWEKSPANILLFLDARPDRSQAAADFGLPPRPPKRRAQEHARV